MILILTVLTVVWETLFAGEQMGCVSALRTLRLSHFALVPVSLGTRLNILCENISSSLRSPSHLASLLSIAFTNGGLAGEQIVMAVSK